MGLFRDSLGSIGILWDLLRVPGFFMVLKGFGGFFLKDSLGILHEFFGDW